MSVAIVEKIEELGKTFKSTTGDLSGRISELEKRAAREPDFVEHRGGALSLGDLVANAPEVKDLTSAFRGKATVRISGDQMAAITSGTGTVGATTSPGTSLVPAHRVDGIVAPYTRELRIRDLLNVAPTTSASIEYPKETGFTNNAAPVAETTLKPTSDLTFNLSTAPVRTIAHIFKVSRQILDDAPALSNYISTRGLYGLKSVEENQLLNGNGTGQNVLGILPQATAFAPAFTSPSETAIDRILQAISQAEDAEIPVTGIAMSKRDWRRILGTKDGEGRYLADQSPFGIQVPTLWGLPVVGTNAIPVGEFVVGAWRDGATLFDRLSAEVLISSENVDDFEKNMLTIRIEERIALAVYRPEAFVTGDLEAA